MASPGCSEAWLAGGRVGSHPVLLVMGWEVCVCRWGWGGRCSQAQRWGVHAPLNPSPFCPHHELLEFHNFNSLAVFFVEKRSTC